MYSVNMIRIALITAILSIYLVTAIPKQEGDRVKAEKLSDEEHYGEDEEHNAEYDHEAFLGKEDAEEFDNLSPEESKRRLGLIVDKIDTNKDGFVTESELTDWIKFVQKRYILEDIDRQWPTHDVDTDDLIEWNEYKKTTYGYGPDDEGEKDSEEEDGATYKEMLQRDKRRWTVADQDLDGKLSKDEFTAFLHPEDAEHMKDVVVVETIEDIDKNKDGSISLEEYIGDMYHGSENEEEPDWVKTEREQFSTYRDKNQDGIMDKEEVKDWIMPSEYDHGLSEARHLMHESDADKDKQLTKDEILEKHDLFVGSQATDFGEALTRHDEF